MDAKHTNKLYNIEHYMHCLDTLSISSVYDKPKCAKKQCASNLVDSKIGVHNYGWKSVIAPDGRAHSLECVRLPIWSVEIGPWSLYAYLDNKETQVCNI